jgi:hypothetical protein
MTNTKLQKIIPFSIILLSSFFVFKLNLVQAYAPPIGIPEPEFGIDETVESVYGSPTHYTYYIDNTHPNSTDTDNTKGSPTTPRKTIPSSFTAGDVVQIHGGPYSNPGGPARFYINGTGTASQPIIITGKNAASKPILTNFIHISNAQYLIVEGLKLQTSVYAVDIRPLANDIAIHHISIRDNEVIGNGVFQSKQSIGAGTTYNIPIEYIVYYKNISSNAGQWDAIPEDDTACFSIQVNVKHAWVLENIGYRSGGDGVILAHNANFSTDHIYIGKNTFYQNRENGIDLK